MTARFFFDLAQHAKTLESASLSIEGRGVVASRFPIHRRKQAVGEVRTFAILRDGRSEIFFVLE